MHTCLSCVLSSARDWDTEKWGYDLGLRELCGNNFGNFEIA